MEKLFFYLVAPLAYTGAVSEFTYHSSGPLAPGSIVTVPFGRRTLTAVVLSPSEKPDFPTKPVTAVVPVPPITPELIKLASWLRTYYAAGSAGVWQTMLPAGIAKNRRSVEPKNDVSPGSFPKSPPTSDQARVLQEIGRKPSGSYLLQGVTGSGKTRVYLELAALALAKNQSVIVLVPEITLTPQIVSVFEKAFGRIVLASHSKLTEAERHRIWLQAATAAADKSPRIIIGPRSCLFMPVSDLGLVVVDECHETSYKQEQHPRYHAVTVASKRARDAGATLVLGSATPGLSELYLAQKDRLVRLTMDRRFNNISHSQAQIIDLRNKELFKSSKFLTQPLVDLLATTLQAGRQSLLFLNRRGSASSQVCADCGHVTICPNCRLPLTFHADVLRLICHHCNFRTSSPAVCPECSGSDLKLLGGGTKRIEAEVTRLFPTARINRLDRDSATIPVIKRTLADLAAGRTDILVGTQMIAKGLDLPAIDVVGIVSADTMLQLPDFSAAERTYQLISQVSGRAGRGDRPGQVLIQTYTPTHPAITAAATGNFDQFAKGELEERRLLNYPPFAYLLKLTVTASSQDQAINKAKDMASQIKTVPGLVVIGPAPAFIENLGGKFHWTLTVKSKSRGPLVNLAANLNDQSWSADLDPVNLL